MKNLKYSSFFNVLKGERKTKKWKFAPEHKLPILYNCLSTSNMILYNCKKVKKNIKKDIKKYEEAENFKITKCPNCESEKIIRWGKYTRNVIYYENNVKHEKTIEIKRIKCNKCGTTHSIIPNFLVPYKIHTIEYINEVIKRKVTKEETYKQTSEKCKISRQLIKYWLDCFSKHYTRIKVTKKENKIQKVIREIEKEIYEFIEKYYRENKQIYMMYIRNEKERPILKWAPT